jgi:hypothetical protein
MLKSLLLYCFYVYVAVAITGYSAWGIYEAIEFYHHRFRKI